MLAEYKGKYLHTICTRNCHDTTTFANKINQLELKVAELEKLHEKMILQSKHHLVYQKALQEFGIWMIRLALVSGYS